MGIGWLARKKGWIDKGTINSFSHILVNIALPSLLISSFNHEYSKDMVYNARMIFIYSIIIHIVLIIISVFFAYKFDEDSKKVVKYVTVFSNAAFMAYPVVGGLYGKIGIFYAAIFNIPINIFMFTAGIIFFTGKRDTKTLKNIVSHPAILATFIGFGMYSLGIKLPSVLMKTFSIVGSMTTPMSMIFIGASLASSKINEIFSDKVAYYASFTRLIIAPIITFIVLRLFNADTILLQVSVLIEAMPAGALAPVLAEKYGANTSLASKCVFITTILSIITIPLAVTFL